MSVKKLLHHICKNVSMGQCHICIICQWRWIIKSCINLCEGKPSIIIMYCIWTECAAIEKLWATWAVWWYLLFTKVQHLTYVKQKWCKNLHGRGPSSLTKMKIWGFIEKNWGFSRRTGKFGVFIKESAFPMSKLSRLLGRLKVVWITYYIVPIKLPYEIGKFPTRGGSPPRQPWPLSWYHPPCLSTGLSPTVYYCQCLFWQWLTKELLYCSNYEKPNFHLLNWTSSSPCPNSHPMCKFSHCFIHSALLPYASPSILEI